MGKGTDLKRRVVLAHAKDLEARLADVLRLVEYPPPTDGQVKEDFAEALARIRNVVSLLQGTPESDAKSK